MIVRLKLLIPSIFVLCSIVWVKTSIASSESLKVVVEANHNHASHYREDDEMAYSSAQHDNSTSDGSHVPNLSGRSHHQDYHSVFDNQHQPEPEITLLSSAGVGGETEISADQDVAMVAYDTQLAAADRSKKPGQSHDIIAQQQQQQQRQQAMPTSKAKEYLTHYLAESACKLDRGVLRRDRLNNTFLNYCTRYNLMNLLSSEIFDQVIHNSTSECERILDEFIRLDELIDQFYVLFKNLLTRYNCHNGYSVKWSCEDCKKAYSDWLCATSLPYYLNAEPIKPCISFCERVEQRCPYLHPITKEQYGGQPVFICRDPNIPFVPEITPDIPYSEPSKCYDLCHLSRNSTELYIDSLSKYQPDKCPDKNVVAEQARNDIYCQHPKIISQLNETAATATGGEEPEIIIEDQVPNSVKAVANISCPIGISKDGPIVGVHMKKLNELKEVLAVYKSQPKTHKFGHH